MVKAFQSDILASITDSSEESMEDESDVEDGDDSEVEDEDEVGDFEEGDFDSKELQHDITFVQYGKRFFFFS